MRKKYRKPVYSGLRNTPTGNSWSAMMSRCFNPNYNGYPPYGGSGITVCEFIKASPLNLVACIGLRPSSLYSIDRINGCGHYSCGTCRECVNKQWPLNIRWATKKEQGENRKTTVFIPFGVVGVPASVIAKTSGLNISTIIRRFRAGKSGNSLVEKNSPQVHEVNGVFHTIREWSELTGIKVKTLQRRVGFGWVGEQLIQPRNDAYVRANYRT